MNTETLKHKLAIIENRIKFSVNPTLRDQTKWFQEIKELEEKIKQAAK
jgi:hypothetical protein